ncbi:MAG: hypothetical protein ABFD46_05845 [Armatimonadota bacterium]
MKVFPVALALAVAIGLITELAFTKTKIYTVRSALTEADSSIVSIDGTVRKVGNNRYVLIDGTGHAELQTCPLWYRTIELKMDENITVTGEILDNSRPRKGSLYVMDVYKIIRNGKPEIVLRTRPGKPPWASGNVRCGNSSPAP